MAKKRGGLGRGLDALFADAAPLYEEDAVQEETDAADRVSHVLEPEVTEKKAKPASAKRKKAAAKPAAEKPVADTVEEVAEETAETIGDHDEIERIGAKTTSTKAPKTKTPAKNKTEAKEADEEDDEDMDRVIYVDINDIKPNKDQPRKIFKEEKIRELANSIQENGVIQPLIIRPSSSGYELVAGERRWRASRHAGLKKVPCIVRNFDEKQNMIVAIIENMQREDLDAIEEAMGLREMIKRFGFTQEQVSNSLGKSRAYIANSLRLLKLPEDIQDMISEGKMSAAHGRTIINVEDPKTQHDIAEKIVRGGLSVRATERLAEKAKDDARPARKRRTPVKNTEIAAAEDELRKIMGTKVAINGTPTAGKLEIEYYSLDELNRLIDLLRGLA